MHALAPGWIRERVLEALQAMRDTHKSILDELMPLHRKEDLIEADELRIEQMDAQTDQ